MKSPADLVRACYAAYENKDRAALENLLSDDFTFTSPVDNHINRARYFERCWPNSQHLSSFDIKDHMVEGNNVCVRYEARTSQGMTFGNTEFFTVGGSKISQVEVYFGSEDPVANNEAEIRVLMEDIAAACRANDVSALVRNYAPDVTAFDLINPLRYCGKDTVKRRADEWFASFAGPIDYQLRDLSISAANDTAFCHSLNELKGAKNDGESIDMWWRETACFEKRDGRWLITHLHSSVPFDMNTGLASSISSLRVMDREGCFGLVIFPIPSPSDKPRSKTGMEGQGHDKYMTRSKTVLNHRSDPDPASLLRLSGLLDIFLFLLDQLFLSILHTAEFFLSFVETFFDKDFRKLCLVFCSLRSHSIP